MIKRINDIAEHIDWIAPFVCDESFSTPFCDQEKILARSREENSLMLAAYEGQKLTGIFCLLVLEEEKYIETLFLYTKEKRAYEDLIEYVSKRYCGYELWLVYNPKNFILKAYLQEKQAFFYTEQKCMESTGTVKEDAEGIIPYSDLYQEDYIKVHSKDGYWDGEKVLAKLADFTVYLCIRDHKLVGYIDVSKGGTANEIMDLWILPAYRNQGIGTLLLKKVLCKSGNRLLLTVDVDNVPANHLYQKMGFTEVPRNSSVTAKLVLYP